MVMQKKTLVRNPPKPVPRFVTTPLTKCSCGGALHKHREIQAKCHDLIGVTDIVHITKECCRRDCRTQYSYNFKVVDGSKINTVSLKDLREKVLFISTDRCFTLRYLEMSENLLFRGFVSSGAFAWSYKETFGSQDVVVQFHKQHNHALFYFMTVKEFEKVNMNKEIIIEDEVSEPALTKYSNYLHTHEYPPAQRNLVTELVGDGHQKVLTKMCAATSKKSKRSKKNRKKKCKKNKHKRFNHGWFMVIDPRSKRIVSVRRQVNPENNAVVSASLEKVLWLYKKCDTFVMDRVCKYKKEGQSRAKLQQLKNYIVDKWHAKKGHNKRCTCSPCVHPRLNRRLRGVNTSICEQTFSWFRGYARTFNELRSQRHEFIVHYFSAKHNTLVAAGDLDHLNAYSTDSKKSNKRKASKGYHCNR